MILTPKQYKTMRESYCYSDRNCQFTLVKTDGINSNYAKKFHGIFSGVIPPTYTDGINIRKFELIVNAVFADSYQSINTNAITESHIENLKEIICAIVHWKMSSQGGRSLHRVAKVKEQWKDNTFSALMNAYFQKDLSLFMIDGIAIATATAILRFIYPEKYGIMDSRVAKITQENNITELSLRPSDGYINNTKRNINQYKNKYTGFLLKESEELKKLNILFNDMDENGNITAFDFRPCDIEMALFCI